MTRIVDHIDQSTIVQDRISNFAEKYKPILTNNEYDFLTEPCQKI